MRTSKVFLLLWLSISLAHGAPPKIEKRSDEAYVSLIQLVANPKIFDGKVVSVGGYLVLRSEYESSLFLDDRAYRAGMWANSVALDFDGADPAAMQRVTKHDRTFVIIAGVFKSGSTAFSGGKLIDVYRVLPAEGE